MSVRKKFMISHMSDLDLKNYRMSDLAFQSLDRMR